MIDLCIVQGFKSKCWPLQACDKDMINMVAMKNKLESFIANATIHDNGVSNDEFYVQVIYFKKSFYNVFGDDLHVFVQKDLHSYSTHSIEEYGYACSLEDYLKLCCNGVFGHKSHIDYSVYLYKPCEMSLEELFIYRDLRKDLA